MLEFWKAFMHEICLKMKQKIFENSIFSFFLKWLQNRSRGVKSVPKHTATPQKCLEFNFDTIDTF